MSRSANRSKAKLQRRVALLRERCRRLREQVEELRAENSELRLAPDPSYPKSLAERLLERFPPAEFPRKLAGEFVEDAAPYALEFRQPSTTDGK